jgi:UDP-N-acetylmuramoyl-L-alanyl-D-glutamate--2,6-diaminopimelate ligase
MALVKLAELAAGIAGARVESGGDAEILGVTQDSRRVRPGDLFVAVSGLRVDGHRYAADAARAGAALAVERDVEAPPGTPVIKLASTRTGLAELAAVFHGRPARSLLVAGVTGTDGKTTTTHMAAHVLESAGLKTAAMSTVALRVGGLDTANSSGLTTMEAPEIQAWLASAAAAGAEAVVLEVTSHALIQARVDACDFDIGAFTNVGRDHLDYHATWEDYLAAKATLIDLCTAGAAKGVPKTAVLNRDDQSFERLAGRPIERRWDYSIRGRADFRAERLEDLASGWRFALITPEGEADVRLPTRARFNVSNALCAAAVGVGFGLSTEAVAAGLSSFPGVPGRLEPVDLGQPFRVFIDFAHSAGALAAVLAELRPLTQGRLIAVFGSTGRSDHDRPGMGRAAAAGADYFLITTDDPVAEDPAEIAREVESGVGGLTRGRDYEVVLDRREAITRAIGLARPGDLVLLAGKGHERTMIMAGGAKPWDERAEAEAAIRSLG